MTPARPRSRREAEAELRATLPPGAPPSLLATTLGVAAFLGLAAGGLLLATALGG